MKTLSKRIRTTSFFAPYSKTLSKSGAKQKRGERLPKSA